MKDYRVDGAKEETNGSDVDFLPGEKEGGLEIVPDEKLVGEVEELPSI